MHARTHSTLPCPSSLRQLWSVRAMRVGFASATIASMGCRADGAYSYETYAALRDDASEAAPYVHVGAFNRSSAFAVTAHQCRTFQWAHAKGPRPIHEGPAILGADKDINRALAGGRLSVSLLHLGMRPAYSARDGLWSPCTNLAFVMCALQGWLPKQGGSRFILATVCASMSTSLSLSLSLSHARAHSRATSCTYGPLSLYTCIFAYIFAFGTACVWAASV